MDLTSCPECGLVAEVVDRDVWPSTDGPVEHAHVRCAAGHRFVLPVAYLERPRSEVAPAQHRRRGPLPARRRPHGPAR